MKEGNDLIRIGLLSFSDGRERVHQTLALDIMAYQEKISQILKATGEIEVISSPEIITSNESAVTQAKIIAIQDPVGYIFNIPVFSFPNFAVIAAQLAQGPILLIGPQDPRYPGLGGLLGAAGGLSQIGIWHEKIWTDLNAPNLVGQILTFARAAYVKKSLRGQVYGLIGGRSIGMYTGAAPAELWQKHFGVDIDHVDQSEILRRAKLVPNTTVNDAADWLKRNVKEIQYDNQQLTPEKLDFEIRCWLGLQEIVDEFSFKFIGVKCHYDLSEYFSVQCLAASFINDPYDWRGPKRPIPMACEADSDGALTMQILTLMSDLPSTLLDLRFYDKKFDVLVMPNCGASATYYAARSQNPADNLNRVKIVPAITKYAGGGAHVQFVFSAGPVTLARLTRSSSGYQLLVLKGETIELPIDQVNGSGLNWPHAYVRIRPTIDTLVQKMRSNHLHMIAGDWVTELSKYCQMANIEYILLE